MIQERSKLTDIEIMLQSMLPVGSDTEEDVSSGVSGGVFFLWGVDP